MASTTPSWLTWTLGIVGAAGAALVGWAVYDEIRNTPDPWEGEPFNPNRKALPARRKTFEPKVLEVTVLPSDQEEDGWTVSLTEYEGMDEDGPYNGRPLTSFDVSTEKQAIREARDSARYASKYASYDVIEVVATKEERKRRAARRERAEAQEAAE